MEIKKINSVNFKASEQLENYIQAKVDKLEQFYDRILTAEVFLRAEKVQQIENKIVGIKLDIAGNELFAEKKAKTFEEATDAVYEALRRQVRKYKDRLRNK